ncbi:hypothetical protein E7Z59_11970 [Robertkochia marina]|uniref:Uncharacterized protein n=1 Tax=Robertkochia marina TaxID=1227945 RepID=A0A4S3LY79_9FLAO|nr:hypothetical protein [Robertkochia marina]THD66512.1 hypothetical protein E7Z59_11970 [Robertkochia marina]TRZ45649.1 hypothetical protein D3A96_06665 [Robertkochia marina]
MKPKLKALVYNFSGFVILFLAFRFGLLYLFPDQYLVMLLISVVAASALSPKFGMVTEKGEQRVKMKWFLLKGVRDVT